MNESGEHPETGNPPPVPRERIGVAGLWLRDGRVLLTRRAASIPYGNLWCFPGGGIDPGEDEITALRREWYEELGIAVRPLRKLGSSEVSGGRFLLHWWLVDADDKPLRPNPAEVAEVRWFDLANLAAMPDLLESNRQLLAELDPRSLQARASDSAVAAHAVASAWRYLQEQLEDLRRRNLHRTLRVVDAPPGRRIRIDSVDAINFASNDYLALAADERLGQAVEQAVRDWGWGAGASRLISGHTRAHADLEAALATFKAVEAALVLSTGYMANLAVLRTLAGEGDVILLDKLNHASILDAAASSGAEVRVFPHRNYAKLGRLLERYGSARRRLIVTDTVFSMDGDLADLPELVRLKQRYDALLVLDEAHATGVLGATGRGVAELQAVEQHIDATVGTLSKALGGLGGFVAGSRLLIDAVVNLGRPFIFTTAMPAAACVAASRALAIAADEPWRRRQALELAARLRQRLEQAGWDCGGSQTQIVPVIVGESAEALRLSRALLDRGFLVPAVRPPAVPAGRARLRLSVTAAHTQADVDGLAEALEAVRRAPPAPCDPPACS